MNLDISAQERQAMHYVGGTVSTRFSEFGAPDGPNAMIPRVYQWLAEHEVTPLGGPVYIYRHIGSSNEDPVDLTVAVPISAPVKPTSGLIQGSLPAGTYVVGRHTGPPDQIHRSRAKVREWATENGHHLDAIRDHDGTMWTGFAEHFLTDPDEEPDPTKWTTELLFKTA